MGRIGQQEALLIGGRYRFVERLGTGGMSVIWRGYDETLGRQVAIKVLSPQLAADAAFRDRLRQEALAAAQLGHPHITGIYDFAESEKSAYVVMELNDGESVADHLQRRGAMGWREAVTMACEVASALATAHASGVVHRDITPANVMLTAAGAKVVDFGISALIGQRDAAPDGSLLGTPAYLAPERLGGSEVRPAADMYALGLLLYRCLTARMPWPASTTTDALRAHLYADPEPLPTLPGMPPEVASWCMRCLAKDPGARPGATEFAVAFGRFLGLQPIVPAEHQVIDLSVRATVPLEAGLSAGRRRSGSARRVRAALRVGRALGVGQAQSLGGGLFRGRLFGAASRTGRGGGLFAGLFAGGRSFDADITRRHRVQALIGVVAVLAIAGLAWSSAREPTDAGPAQAAAVVGPGARPAVPRRMPCQVRYQVKRDSGREFEAQLTIDNTSDDQVIGWRLSFAYPGTQRLSAEVKGITQTGRKVVVRGRADRSIRPGKSATVTLRGTYRDANPLPIAYQLNGHDCQSLVLGATNDIIADKIRPAQVAEAADESPPRSAKPHTSRSADRTPRKPQSPPASTSPVLRSVVV
jgi:serine/threonine-protein kinase